MKNMRKWFAAALCAVLALAMIGCGNQPAGDGEGAAFDASTAITVVSREDGSGTRSAFVELTGVLAEG